MSDYQLEIADDYNISICNLKKLVPNFFNKEKYVLQYKNLQLYLWLELNKCPYMIQKCIPEKDFLWLFAFEKSSAK